MSDILLSLSTKIKPPKKFMVDGDEFDILGLDHLGPADETEVVAQFARYGVLSDELSMEGTAVKGKQIAEKLRQCRVTLISKLTTLPKDVAEKLPISAQARLLDAIRAEVEAEPDEEEATASGASAGE